MCLRLFTRFVRSSLNCETTDTNPFRFDMSSPSAKESNRATGISRQGRVTKSQAQSGMRADAFPVVLERSDLKLDRKIGADRNARCFWEDICGWCASVDTPL